MAVSLIHVVRRFVPQEWGGVETLVVNCSHKLVEHGFGSRVFTTNSMSRRKREAVLGLDVSRFSYFYPYWGLKGDRWTDFDRKGGNAISFPMFFRLLQDTKVDVVQLFAMGRLGAMVATACRLKGIPYVVNIQGGFPEVAPKTELEQFQKPLTGTLDWGKPFGALFGARKLMDNADAIACGGGLDYEYAKEKYPDKPIHFLPCCVDTKKFAAGQAGAFKKKYGLEGRRVLLNVGRIDTQKNQKLIVNTMPDLLREFGDLHLVLIGAVTIKSYRDEIKSLIVEKGLTNHVLMIEGLDPGSPDLVNAYTDCELFVLASIQECGATVVLEAMSAGKPVVASNAGGLPWIIEDGTDGLLFASDNGVELGQKLATVLRSEETARTIGRAGLETVKRRFDWGIVAGQLAGICNEAIAARRGTNETIKSP